MPYRWACVVGSRAELADVLAEWPAGAGDRWWSGEAAPGGPVDPVPRDRSGLLAAASGWCRGHDLDFAQRWAGTAARRVQLPVYRFDLQRCWLYTAAPLQPPDPGTAPAPMTPGAAGLGEGEKDEAFLEGLAEAFPAERLDLLIADVQRIAGEWLGFTPEHPAQVTKGFFDLGLDSISSTRIYRVLVGRYGRELDMQLFFNYPNITAVARYILDLLDSEDPRRAAEDTPKPGVRVVEHTTPHDPDSPLADEAEAVLVEALRREIERSLAGDWRSR